MRKPVLIIFTNALILIVVFVLLAQSLVVVQRLAQAQELKGLVEVQRQGRGNFQPLAPGATVAVGDVVRTGKNGEVEFAWADRTRWKLTPQTTLTVQKASLDTAQHVESARFRLDAGKVFVRVVKLLAPASTFEVETPSAVAAVQGSVFSIAAVGEQTKVEVWKGDVQLTAVGGTKNTVKSGQQALAGNCTPQVGAMASDSQAPSDLLRPEIDAFIAPGNGNNAVLRGSTEAGGTAQINGKQVPVVANGLFFQVVKLKPGYNTWTIQATDHNRESTTICRAVTYDAQTQKIDTATCGVK